MILSGLKKYFVNLKYYFTPVGMLAVGMVFGLSILIPGAISAMKEFIDEFVLILQNNNIDFNPTKDYIVNSITSLDWSDPITALGTMISGEWLKELIDGSMQLVGVQLQAYAELINAAFEEAVAKIVAYVVVFIVLCVIGLICGFMLTKFLVRRNMAKRKLWQAFLAALADSVITVSFLAFSAWLSTVWVPGVAITVIFAVILFSLIALFEGYLVHGVKAIPFSKVISIGNALKLIITNALIFVISIAFLGLSIGFTNPFAGLFIGFAFVEIAFIVMSLNAESYVKDLVERTSASGVKPIEDTSDNAA